MKCRHSQVAVRAGDHTFLLGTAIPLVCCHWLCMIVLNGAVVPQNDICGFTACTCSARPLRDVRAVNVRVGHILKARLTALQLRSPHTSLLSCWNFAGKHRRKD